MFGCARSVFSVFDVERPYATSDEMLASFLLLVSLIQDGATPTPFLWMIEGMGNPKSLTVVTISLTPYGLGNGIEVETISLDPLPTRDDPKPRAIRPVKTEPAPALRSGWRERGLRAWFTPPGRRFHLIVTLSDGSTHRIDIYRPVPPSGPKPKATPIDRTIPMWTGGVYSGERAAGPAARSEAGQRSHRVHPER